VHQPSIPAGPLRIAHVAPAYAPLVGGAERLLQSVSERLAARGHDVTVLTFDCATMRDFLSPRGAGLPPSEMLNGVRVIRVSPMNSRLHRLHRWWLNQPGGWRTSSWFFGRDLWPLVPPSGLGMVSALTRLEADVITAVNWVFSLSYWVCPPRFLRRTPRVAVPILHIEREWAFNPTYKRMLGDCDGVIVCTEAERDFVEARGGRDVAVAGAGVDPARFERRDGASIRARYGIGDRPVVGFVGRQDAMKGVPTLIEAMRTVWSPSCAPNAVLLMAGQSAHRDGNVTARLAALSEDERSRVVLIDDFPDEDGPSIMDACDLLALPSSEEAFGLVMIEAWMCGKPVIGADIASTRCIIDSGVDGWTARPFDASDLASKILDLLADPTKRALFGARGRAKVLSRYTWDRVTDVWESSLQQAAASRQRSTRQGSLSTPESAVRMS
jgi:glycosyltransferase involved in cell wall biosynthesis